MPSTFFPSDWNRVQVTNAIKQAYSNRKVIKDNLNEGMMYLWNCILIKNFLLLLDLFPLARLK
ncbi:MULTISPECIES: EndoU domain-containing protein [Heyndrickxia]|uniref:EndoU domain-containing protein n=1 Tax=Heyndrickxia TaxID=2837504 RepID=UPI001F2CE703|nr:EndoU domain-containing protein [Heyndrickxia sporothermodurans]MED3650405.1 EndoU domain-containing protein [Heyndrickxia sporothermodurans]MED3698603.1 EndoU domain-containing protein [Heyndrickxia sporothermodurans]MED3780683.1 EndoU domain-containing protein [Heyndrickxia sporothermodurans]